jgi:parvulin-like peptidyl-prolyl isomerase
MTKGYKTFLAICLIWGFTAWPGLALGGEPSEDRIAARVNGVAISLQAAERIEALIRGSGSGELASAPEQERRRRLRLALESVIAEELLYQEAVSRGIEIDKEKVYEEIRRLKETLPDENFSRLLVAHWAVKGEILKTVERNLMIQRLLKVEVFDQAKVSQEELRSFYNNNQALFNTGPEVRLQQILLFAKQEWEVELARSKADEIAARARAGEDFIGLVSAYSQGPARDRSGDLGWRSLKILPQHLKAAVQEAPAGTIIGPVQTPGGLVIAKVLAKRPSRTLRFEEVRDHLARNLGESVQKQRQEAFLKALRARATVEVFLP